MAYNNVSFYEAKRILTGKENNRWNLYDRYQKPKEWPSLPISSRIQTVELQKESVNRPKFQEKSLGTSYHKQWKKQKERCKKINVDCKTKIRIKKEGKDRNREEKTGTY